MPQDIAWSGTSRQDGVPLRISLLGGFRVACGDRVLAEDCWRLQKAKSLVKLLALASGHQLGRERIADLLWPDLAPEAVGNNFHRTLHAARRALGRGHDRRGVKTLHLSGGLVTLRSAGSLWIDVAAFDAAAATARHTRSLADYRVALDLYGGELLPEDRYEDWASGRREALRATFLGLLLGLARLYEERGDWARGIAALDRLVTEDPAHEEGHVGLMRLHALAGQRSQAVRQWARLREALRRDLDTEPDPAAQRLYAEILAGHFPSSALDVATGPAVSLVPPRRDNLPTPLTSFIGRERAIVAVEELLHSTRLLTLTGTGGCGKTRLALAVAANLATSERYPDGVWLAELAAVTDPALVPGTIAGALGLRERAAHSSLDSLADALQEKVLLLVLDNCEHLAAACAHLVQRLLAAAPTLHILTTSRAALHVQGEVIWTVPPLRVPAAREGFLPEVLISGEAVAVFLDRVRWRRPGFTLTSENATAVADICRRLEGLPLALELAAARAAVLSPAQLADRLDDALAILAAGDRAAPARQRTLRATLDWSHELLTGTEQTLLRRFAPFVGSWTLEAAEAVCTDSAIPSGDILVLLAALVDHSLVQVEAGADAREVRYRLLEPVRQYAWERLVASGEEAEICSRHVAYYLALAEEAEPALIGPEQENWLTQLEREHDNLRVALHYTAGTDGVERAARLCAALWRFWYVRGYLVEGERWLTGTLVRDSGEALPTAVRAKLLQGVGTLALSRGDIARAEEVFDRALALFREVDDRRGIAAVLHALGLTADRRGDYARATSRSEESLHLSEQAGHLWGAAITLQTLGNLAKHRDAPRQAAALYERSMGIHRRLGDRRGVAIALNSLGNLAFEGGDDVRATTLYQESLILFRALGDRPSSAIVLKNLASLALRGGDYRLAAALCADGLHLAREVMDQRGIALGLDGLATASARRGDLAGARCAARLHGAAEGLRASFGLSLEPAERAEFVPLLAAARATLGEGAFVAARTVGGTLTPEEAITEAFAVAAALTADVACPGADTL